MKRPILFISITCVGILLCAVTLVWAQEPFVLPRLDGPVRLDGWSNEPAWQRIEPLPLAMMMPNFGNAPSKPTEIRVAYDDAYLYVAGRCYDDPEDITGTSFKRDIFTTNIDYLGLVLDTFNDNENALAFFVTPTGPAWISRFSMTHRAPSRSARVGTRSGMSPSCIMRKAGLPRCASPSPASASRIKTAGS